MKKFKFILTLFLLIFNFCLSGQNHISGIVVDEMSKERLAFVNIVINEDGTHGTTTDIDGNFSITSKNKIKYLTFSFVGYEKKKIEIKDGEDEVFVKMKPQSIELSEIVIDGNNNPANRIIDSVFKYRDSNNPKNQNSFHYKMYDNMIFAVDTTNLPPGDEFFEEFKNNDLMAMETVSEQYYQKPNKNKKIILANKVSGLKNSMGVYLLENIQSIGFSEDLVTIYQKKYVNPISKGSKNKYIFFLESSYKTNENDSIFTIAFAPYKNTTFNSLKGTITINSDNWAIQNIKAAPSSKQEMFEIDIQQLYEKVDGVWFPRQLNTNLKFIFPDGNGAGSDGILLGIGKSYISEIEINKEIDKNIFDLADYSVNSNARKSDDLIKNYRYEKLDDERLDATYKYVDSVLNQMNFNFDKIYESLDFIMQNEIPIGIVSLNIDDFLDYNIGNGWMFGLGLKTNDRLSKVVSIGGFGNYWTKAKEFNYGGDLSFNILPSKDMKLKLAASHKFERLGDYGFEEKTNMLNSADYKHFYVNATSLNNSASASISTYFNKYLKGFVNFEVADKTVFDRQSTADRQTYRLSTIDLKLRIAFKEKFVYSRNKLSTDGVANPVIWLSYHKNLEGVFGSPYNFDKIEFQFKGKKEFKYLGVTSIMAQAGYINGFVPMTELFNIEGTANKDFGIYCTETFSTMRPDEFFCDRFAALYFSHNFRNLLIDFKKFHPEIIIVTNIAFGNCNSNSQSLRFSDSQVFNNLNKGYYESGIVIDSIIKSGFSKIGLGAFYRYGPYSYDKTWDNFAFKITVGFSL